MLLSYCLIYSRESHFVVQLAILLKLRLACVLIFMLFLILDVGMLPSLGLSASSIC